MRFPERYQHRGQQSTVDPSNTNHTNGLRFKRIDIRNFVNERQQWQAYNGRQQPQQQQQQQQRAANGHQIPSKGGPNFTNGQAAFVNGHVPLNNHHGSAMNGHEATINGHPTTVNEHPSANNAAKGPPTNGYRNIITGCQNGLFINKMVVGDDLIKPSRE